MNKTYAILGGNGVFGVHTALYLLEHAAPARVICIGRNPHKQDAFSLGLGKNPRYEYHQIHIGQEQDRLFELFDTARPQTIINFAALAYGTSWDKSWRYYDTNIVALARMTETLSKRHYLQRFIQIGSSELYGATDSPATEAAPLKPTSPYAVSKAAADMHLMTLKGFPWNILRPSNAYGSGQAVYRVIPRAILCGLTGQRLHLQGGGLQRKSYLYAQDLARAIHLIDEKAGLERIYNCGPSVATSIKEVVETVAEVLDVPFENMVSIAPGRSGEDAQYWLDSSAIYRDTGWTPKISLESGIKTMVAWAQKYLPVLRSEPVEYTLHA